MHKILNIPWILHCFDNVLCYMFSATLKHTIKQKYYHTKLEKRMLCQIWQFQLNRYKNCSLDKTGEGNVVSDLAISPQKYPKIDTQEKEKFQGICDTVFQNYVIFLWSFDIVLHMFKCINQTFHKNKKKTLALPYRGSGG